VDQAVRLVRQAVLQDSKRNYGEAARCYREAITSFRELRHSRASSKRLQELLDTKLGQYEKRLRILDEHLLSTSDLTKFFKELKPSSCRSSVSSESRHLYKNPLLGQALDLLRRGRKEDERGNFGGALVFYESGLASLFDILRNGHLTERQTESARVKCLLYHERAEAIRSHLEGNSKSSLERGRRVSDSNGEEENLDDSDCDSPVPPTESEKALQMEEVVSCTSRLGSLQSLNCSPEPDSASRASSACSNVRDSPLHEATKPSTHSLYPMCEIKRSPSVLSEARGSVPLVDMNREMSISSLSILSNGERDRDGSEEDVDHSEQIIVLGDDNDVSYELIKLKEKDEEDDEGSDSGYSGRSPDGTIRDSKSPSSEVELSRFSSLGVDAIDISDDVSEEGLVEEEAVKVAKETVKVNELSRFSSFGVDAIDRKSSFSDDVSEEELVEEEAVKVPLVPEIIVVKEGGEEQERLPEEEIPRQAMLRQRSRFQTPGKGILQSQESQDALAVVKEDEADGLPRARVRLPETRVVAEEMYGRPVVRGERIPVRGEAQGEHGEMNMGCYYLMAALDFCWCL